MNQTDYLNRLDPAQKKAATIKENAVIASGAGSGKTRVLTSRYLHLLIDHKIPIDEIYALTFTQKAASEMYGRIYEQLAKQAVHNKNAQDAFRNFEQAHIGTLDSLCNDIAKKACARYGVSPDYTIDNDKAEQLATNLALPFFLKHRSSPAIQQLLKQYSIKQLPYELLAETMQKHSTISSPLDFTRFYQIQKTEIEQLFYPKAKIIIQILHRLYVLALEQLAEKPDNKTAQAIKNILNQDIIEPDIKDNQSIVDFIAKYESINAIKMPGRVSIGALVEIKSLLQELRYSICKQFSSIANWILNEQILKECLHILNEFQEQYLQLKRISGVLTFNDVSQMALDALIQDPILRAFYKNSISAIMIDEFQDNNQKQRDLLYVLAEKPERMETSVPEANELCPNKLFFVGDEKQSIYRFRGAEVSVFKKLSQELKQQDKAQGFPILSTNYRSEQRLLNAFNTIFPYVFLHGTKQNPLPLYEAEFSEIQSTLKNPNLQPEINVLIINETNFDAQIGIQLDKYNTEAKEVAQRIKHMKESGYMVLDHDIPRPCTWDDFAILFRSSTRQGLYEKYLREEGIPYQTDILKGLFSDAPINDLYALLRLAVFPKDRTAYAHVLTSPFVRLSAEGFTTVMLNPDHIAFDPEIELLLEDSDKNRFSLGRTCFEKIQSMVDIKPITELITHLWYIEGYRYPIMSNPELSRYTDLYDYFFELGRQADENNEPLAIFLDRIAALMETNEKVEGLDIPVEQSGGVRMMTIHKSKGLEFPIVFIVDAGNKGKSLTNIKPVYFSKQTGISINTGNAEDTEDSKDSKTNYFFLQDYELELKQNEAELRRLLYVAMTRSELKLIITGILSLSKNEEENNRTNEIFLESIQDWIHKTETNEENKIKRGGIPYKRSLFELLLPAFRYSIIENCTLEEIMPKYIDSQNKHKKVHFKNKLFTTETQTFLKESKIIKPPQIKRNRYRATDIKDLKETSMFLHQEFSIVLGQKKAQQSANFGNLEQSLEKLNLSPSDFGTLVHRYIESQFKDEPFSLPQELTEASKTMSLLFFQSQLGQKVQKAQWKKNEFSFITRYKIKEKELIVTGQIDLLFEYNNKIYLVDFKTDAIENPSIHKDQLQVYKKAIMDLYPNIKIEAWIFYLRTGNAVFIENP